MCVTRGKQISAKGHTNECIISHIHESFSFICMTSARYLPKVTHMNAYVTHARLILIHMCDVFQISTAQVTLVQTSREKGFQCRIQSNANTPTNTNTHTYTKTCTHKMKCTYAHTRNDDTDIQREKVSISYTSNAQTRTHTHARTHTHMYTYANTRTRKKLAHAHTHTHTHTYTHICTHAQIC